jgi:hypothetical protein
MNEWPSVELDHIARLRVLSEVLPGVWMHERVIDAPFDEVWGLATDFERVPQFDTDVHSVRVIEREGGRLRLRVRASVVGLGVPAGRVDVDLEQGWCWMRSPMYLVGMAASPEGQRTRFAHLEGFHVRGPRWLQLVLRPLTRLSRWRHRYHVPADVDGMERCLGLRK